MTASRRAILGASIVLPLLGGRSLQAASEVARPVLRTQAGTLRGIWRGGVRCFRGIPYGSVPCRFRPPAPAEPWSGIRDAGDFGPAAPQPAAPEAGPAMSEQCLSVNVCSPPGASGLPVLVWVHGGANVSGSSAQAIYDGTRFARDGVVCVTFNYRLGVFGFLELGAVLGPAWRGSGNQALRDQLLLLRWVRDNIAAFGGDPARVTLAGESAGAKDVAALLVCPEARGLFGRVILESGGGLTAQSMAAGAAVARAFLDVLELAPGDEAQILHLPAARLLAAQHSLIQRTAYAYPLRPLIDRRLLPAMPELAVGEGLAASVPMLLGTNRDESRLFLRPDAAGRPLSGRLLSNMEADGFERIRRLYPLGGSANEARPRWQAMTAEEYWVPTLRLAEAQSRAGGSVWMYRFDKGAVSGRFLGSAAHASELAYVWDNPEDPVLAPLIAGFDAGLSSRMHAAWVAFIRGDAPAAAGLPTWPRYEASRRATMILDRTSEVVNDPDASERDRWRGARLGGSQGLL